MKYLCAVLNASLTTWFMQATALTSGMGVTRWFSVFVETIPIPKLSKAKQRPFVLLVERILEAKTAAPDADTGGAGGADRPAGLRPLRADGGGEGRGRGRVMTSAC